MRPFRDELFHLDEQGGGYLIANRCEKCQITFFPKREFCVRCYKSDRLNEIILSKVGRLHTFTTVYRSTPDFKTAYTVGYVDLDKDGVRIFGPISDCKPEDLCVGMRMELTFDRKNIISNAKDSDKLLIYKFRPLK